MPSIRFSFLLIAVFTLLAILIALVMQYQFDMSPCPLCMTQRIFVIALGLSALLGALIGSSKWGALISSSLGLASAVIGGYFSAKHVWIQNLPEDQIPICGPGLSYMFETRPLFEALSLLFSGDGHCADVNFSLLGLTIPGWTLVLFVVLGATMIWQLIRTIRRPLA